MTSSWLDNFLSDTTLFSQSSAPLTDSKFWTFFSKLTKAKKASKQRINPHPASIISLKNKQKLHSSKSILQEAVDCQLSFDNNSDAEAKRPVPSKYNLKNNKKRKRSPFLSTTQHKDVSGSTQSNNCNTNKKIDLLQMKELTQALQSRPTKKTPGHDFLPYEAFTKAHKLISNCLLTLYSCCWKNGLMPKSWGKYNITLLAKPGKNKQSIDSYRPISLTLCLLKIYETLINNRLKAHLQKKAKLPAWFGCTNGTGADEIISYTMQLVQDWKQKKLLAHALSLDLSKAYNRVRREVLWKHLKKTGISQTLFNAIRASYEWQSTTITIGAKNSHPFILKNGIRQGSVLSTTLYMVYMLSMAEDLNNLLSNNSSKIQAFFYIDDVLILTNDTNLLEKAIQCTASWAQNNKAVISSGTKGKSAIITSAHKGSVTHTLLQQMAAEANYKLSQSLIYLGFHISFLLNTFENHVHERREKTREKIGALTPLYKIMSLEKKIKIFNDVLIPSLTFGSRVYFQKANQIEHSNNFMHYQLCNLLQLKSTANQLWVRWECKIIEWEIQTTANKFKFIHKLYHCKKVSLYRNKILQENSHFITNLLQHQKNWGDLISSPLLKKPKKTWNKAIKKRAIELNLALTKSHIDSDMLSAGLSKLLPISAPENHIFLSFAKKINLLTTLFKIRSNSLFTNDIQCSKCKKNLAPEKTMLHLLFTCPNCKTRDLLNSSLNLLWDAKTLTSWKKQTNCLKLLLLTGANSTSKKDPLQNINSIPATLLVLKQTILEIEPELTEDADITRQIQDQV